MHCFSSRTFSAT
ncbi:hypothetical protein EYF80_065089 [Liparis tanakae]|uniref:Uncharacterized protein n=1 Tax=Liparis tanakae TaxID=230148 RepID=A0A4Z2E7Q0_9TELE|nr:hypothetical protein EYF80_065089 [Liparis tanakae]